MNSETRIIRISEHLVENFNNVTFLFYFSFVFKTIENFQFQKVFIIKMMSFLSKIELFDMKNKFNNKINE